MREAVFLRLPLPYGRMTYIRFQGSDVTVLSAVSGSPSVFVPSERGHYITSRPDVNIRTTSHIIRGRYGF